jgi:hypothetical protein
METVLIDVLVSAATNYPWLSGFIAVLGTFRAIFKPTMAVLDTYVSSTQTKTDDLWLVKLKASKIYQAVVWAVDYSFSIKLPK